MLQDAMPNLSADQREFLLTGYTAADWDEVFGKEDELTMGDEPAF